MGRILARGVYLFFPFSHPATQPFGSIDGKLSNMGDLGETSQRWMPPTAPQALPLGKGNIYPLGEPHVSTPTM